MNMSTLDNQRVVARWPPHRHRRGGGVGGRGRGEGGGAVDYTFGLCCNTVPIFNQYRYGLFLVTSSLVQWGGVAKKNSIIWDNLLLFST